ncbi:response regulator [Paenibacillus sp. 1011MAR3C5]|uniref:response regulator n=1 Tax=Paenibacillus sp. 1011MAR3C5 TaxID=1675787 RepID=UPI000E6CBD7E|nr:response regulator [Paenibacillus sp. 1011MAR3C5]RJE87616.1 response regulator [Paenibacillus sp. 1011MAR3C5]
MWKVLLVEDEFFVRESVKELIRWEELGFTLSGEAGDGIEALEKMKADAPDLVLTDIVMPRMDGIQLLKEAKEAGMRSKFIMLTCMGEFEYIRQAMEYGASNYILKLSMSVNDLRDTLTKMNKELMSSREQLKGITAASSMQPDNRSLPQTAHPEVNKILGYIEQNYAQDITVKSLSQYVMMGENYVSALFKKKTGRNLIHYVHEVRIGHAKRLLKETELPVHEIGLRVGFANDNYFIKIFKRDTGVTPSQYRHAEAAQ